MKKILVAAIAATMSVGSFADISITGNATFDYKHIKDANVNKNITETEVNLHVKAKNGATNVVANLELGKFGSDNKANGLEVEDLYVTTKIGPIGIKAGNFGLPTSALLGEIYNGDRKNGKTLLSYTTNGAMFYAGNTGNGYGKEINSQMYIGAVATVGGWKLSVEKSEHAVTGLGVSGKVGPIGIRLEFKNNKKVAGVASVVATSAQNQTVKDAQTAFNTAQTAFNTAQAAANTGAATSAQVLALHNATAKLAAAKATVTTAVEAAAGSAGSDQTGGNVIFLHLTTKLANIDLGLAYLKAQSDKAIAQDDSSIFKVSNAGKGNSNLQANASINVDGTTYGVKVGRIGFKKSGKNNSDYYEVSASRSLSSGVIVSSSYTKQDSLEYNTDKKTFNVELKVTF